MRGLCRTNLAFQDNSDAQYRSFRNNIPALAALSLAFLVLKFVYTRAVSRSLSSATSNNLHHIPFLVYFSVIMLIGLHGTSIIKIFVILGINYAIAKDGRERKWTPLVTWAFNGAVLFMNEWNSGYRFASIHPSFGTLVCVQYIYKPAFM